LWQAARHCSIRDLLAASVPDQAFCGFTQSVPPYLPEHKTALYVRLPSQLPFTGSFFRKMPTWNTLNIMQNCKATPLPFVYGELGKIRCFVVNTADILLCFIVKAADILLFCCESSRYHIVL
jgi:hypothetical protein